MCHDAVNPFDDDDDDDEYDPEDHYSSRFKSFRSTDEDARDIASDDEINFEDGRVSYHYGDDDDPRDKWIG